MVSTRKKDYGEPPPPKKRARPKVNEDDDPNQISSMKFTWFPKLPPELRIEIWKMSMTPRLVVVQPRWIAARRLLLKFKKTMFPAHLSVNCEAREIAWRHYSLKLTLTVTVDITGLHSWDCPDFQSRQYSARAVMSPDDTLGFLGWEDIRREYGWKFQVESEERSDPWARWAPQNARLCGAQPQPEVTKVAFLRPDFRCNPEAIDFLNFSNSRDLRSILHTKSDKLRKIFTHGSPGHTTPGPGSPKDHVLIHSRNFNGTLEQWGERLLRRIEFGGLPESQEPPDILAFELGRQPDPIPVLKWFGSLAKWAGSSPEDKYFWREQAWVLRLPDSRGF
ncbi:hypothetical protein KVR01_012011 [Diaporthe batatas]|uniref:uncharacterized protein n=1 Tax=Diaporthe batatas TaxID=748121 RepID=UPI001D03E8FC|nr:uncharacterized protein KVR01_012011 [Diaporthe batatas]KAG8158250.1 hypothetical protein KVR01_012011 [Diaporthe batatas]